MNFTDLFIRKPVLAMTISLLILVLGVRSLTSLSVRQYPKTQNAVVTVSTAYYGADAQTVAGFITQPLEGAIMRLAAYPPNHSVLQYSKQLRLDRVGHLGELVQEERAGICYLQETGLVPVGARECPFTVAEHLRFQERLRQCGAVHRHQGSAGTAGV